MVLRLHIFYIQLIHFVLSYFLRFFGCFYSISGIPFTSTVYINKFFNLFLPEISIEGKVKDSVAHQK